MFAALFAAHAVVAMVSCSEPFLWLSTLGFRFKKGFRVLGWTLIWTSAQKGFLAAGRHKEGPGCFLLWVIEVFLKHQYDSLASPSPQKGTLRS